MAVNTRLSAPSYKIYEPDALDVALSAKVLDPLQGGIAGAMLLNHGVENQMAQQQYLKDSDKFNRIAQGIEQMEIAQKHREALTKGAVTLLGHGASTTDLEPGTLEGLFTPGGYQSNTLGKLMQDKLAADAAHARSAGSGGAGKEYTTEHGYNAQGDLTYDYRYQGAPKSPAPNIPPPPNGPGVTPAPAGTDRNSNAALNQQIMKRGMAAVGASDPRQVEFGNGPSGGYVVRNKATGVTKQFDPSGKQDR